MKTIITKKIVGLALSVFSITAVAQCPSITNLNSTNGSNGTATVTAVLSNSLLVGPSSNFYWTAYPSANQTSNAGTFQFPSNGTYSVCLNYIDSLNSCWSSLCTSVTISNMTAPSCNAQFNYYTDSNCVTNFINTPSANGYSMWYVDGMTYSYTPSVTLTNGAHTVTQFMYDQNGLFCDSSSQSISVYCPSSSTVTPNCSAGFLYYTDSTNCTTYFYNTSVTNNGSVVWNVDGVTYSVTPTIALTNGAHNEFQTVYDQNGLVCDTAYQSIYVYCANNGTTTPTGCQVSSQFYIFGDSLNPGNYFAYNLSSGSGTLSYLWNFGDGSTSTQQYPFHQYAVPGQYIICLTVTSTSGSLTCTDTYCDSSSVQRMAAGFQMSQVNVIPLSVTSIKNQEKTIGLNAFPNPMTDELTIEVKTVSDHTLNYVLIDALGRTVLTGNINNSKAVINTSDLENGFYSLSVINEKGSSLKTIKIVK